MCHSICCGLLIVFAIFGFFSGVLCTSINDTFPNDFLFGVASSAYQTEGAWNEGGKGENIWDRITHKNPERIDDFSNGDISCDSYHKIAEDVKLLTDLGVDFYRFSLSWSRILPTGFSNYVNDEGVKYYDTLINELLRFNITPMVTLYHWDLPQSLQEIGGWTNPVLADYFLDYAQVAFEKFGDRVKYWNTINEPKQFCIPEYGKYINLSGIGDYLCGKTTLMAHAKAYHLYQEKYKPTYNGKISIVLNIRWKHPQSTNQTDLDASERMMHFILGWFANPIYHKDGDYPQVMKEYVKAQSMKEGFPRSRLPELTPEEIDYIKGTYDFFGVNLYTTRLVTPVDDTEIHKMPSFFRDANVQLSVNESWPSTAASWHKAVPWGTRKVLNWIKNHYDNPEIFILENGFADDADIKDYNKIKFHKSYLKEVLNAMYIDNVKVIGYTVWSLLDSFEWKFGYRHRYGLYHVDFNDPNRTRTMKNSARMYKRLIRKKKVIWNDYGET